MTLQERWKLRARTDLTACLIQPPHLIVKETRTRTVGVAQCHSDLVADMRPQFSSPDTQTSTCDDSKDFLQLCRQEVANYSGNFYVEEGLWNDQMMGKWQHSWVFAIHRVEEASQIKWIHSVAFQKVLKEVLRVNNQLGHFHKQVCFLPQKKVSIQPFSPEICKHWLNLCVYSSVSALVNCVQSIHASHLLAIDKLCWWKAYSSNLSYWLFWNISLCPFSSNTTTSYHKSFIVACRNYTLNSQLGH